MPACRDVPRLSAEGPEGSEGPTRPRRRPGAEFLQAGDTDSALVLLRMANDVYQEEPNASYYLGILFSNAQQIDSAASYFQRAADVAGRHESLTEDRN